MSRACKYRMLVYSGTTITGDSDTARVTIPADVGDYYFKATFTEDSAGAVTATLYGNETDSITGAFILDDLGGAASSTSVNRAFRAAMSATSQEVLPGYLYINTATVSGSWTLVVELFYSKSG